MGNIFYQRWFPYICFLLVMVPQVTVMVTNFDVFPYKNIDMYAAAVSLDEDIYHFEFVGKTREQTQIINFHDLQHTVFNYKEFYTYYLVYIFKPESNNFPHTWSNEDTPEAFTKRNEYFLGWMADRINKAGILFDERVEAIDVYIVAKKYLTEEKARRTLIGSYDDQKRKFTIATNHD